VAVKRLCKQQRKENRLFAAMKNTDTKANVQVMVITNFYYTFDKSCCQCFGIVV